MNPINYDEIPKMLCKAMNKYGMVFHFECPENRQLNVTRTAPWFNEDFIGKNYFQMLYDGCGFLMFDTEEEMNEIFLKTIKDEIQDGEDGVYAMTIGNDGEWLSENT